MVSRESEAFGQDCLAVAQTRAFQQGTGVIGMKLMGEGQYTTPERRDASLKYVLKLGTVDSMTIGFKTIVEIDEAIQRINDHWKA